MLKPRAMTVAAALVASCIAALLVGPAPATAKTASTFSEVRESCSTYVGENGQPVCRDFLSDVTLEPVDGGMRVSWTRGKEDFVVSACGPQGFFGPLLGNCPVVSQSVKASFDPVTGTGGQSCEAPNMADLTCTIVGLKNGVQYSFRVTSRAGGVPYEDMALYTSSETATASPCCSVPGAPSKVTAVPVGNAVDVTWAQPMDWGGASALTYRVSTTPASTTCEAQVLACRLENVPRGVPVVVNVTASNAAGSSTAAVSPSFRIPVTAPEPPPAVAATYPRPGTAKVSWTAPVNDGGEAITTYVATARPGGRTCTTSQRSCTITGLPGGKTYSFTVTAANGVGTSQPSPTGVAGVLVNPASAPRDASASVSGSSARVSWGRPASLGGGRLLQYIVRAGSSTCTAKATSCTLNGLALGRTYPVTVTAVTTGGRSRPATTSLTTVAPQPVKPTQTLD
jgi:Fibronectin type III domain